MIETEYDALRRIVAILRSPEGCPWDREQTLETMSRCLQEEAAEVRDATLEAGGGATPAILDELGDVLMNVLLMARIAEEAGAFDAEDVARTSREKLVRRHPHVFGDARADTAAEVLVRWNEIKEAERPARRTSRLDGIPRSMDPLSRAEKVSARAAKAGFDWPEPDGALAKVREEVEEVAELLGDASENLAGPGDARRRERLEEELGDVLFSTVNLCRKLGIHPDVALRRTVTKFTERFEHIERRLPNLEERTLEEMDRIWDEVRKRPSERLEGETE